MIDNYNKIMAKICGLLSSFFYYKTYLFYQTYGVQCFSRGLPWDHIMIFHFLQHIS